jgi:hypothetical protein
MRASGTHVGVLRTPIGPAAPTGRRLTLRGIEVFGVQDDLIAEVWTGWDWSSVYAELGAAFGER